MLKLKSNKVLMQIGTNNGKDDFSLLAHSTYSSKVILVEPNASLNAAIHKRYASINNYVLENVAITIEQQGEVSLVHPKNEYDAYGEVISSWNYHDVHFSLIPMDDWGDDFDVIKAPSMTFEELCKKHGVTDIHYLQIDVEGYDTEIIKSIDFRKYNIDILKFEDWTFSEDCFKRHGEKGKEYGVNGMRYVEHMLINLGYTLTREESDILCVKNYPVI